LNMSTFVTAIKSSLVLGTSSITKLHQLQGPVLQVQQRTLFGWLNSIFNRYDKSRVDEVGPDRACAEWLLRCGAGVKWNRDEEWFRDYNSLPSIDQSRHLTIREIDGTDSAVMYMGFPFLKGLKNCEKIVFHKAHYLDDEALLQLSYLQDSLKDLQISSCGNVSTEGIMALSQLHKLEKLLLYDLPLVRNKEQCVDFLSKVLPRCKINFPYAQASEMKQQSEDKK